MANRVWDCSHQGRFQGSARSFTGVRSKFTGVRSKLAVAMAGGLNDLENVLFKDKWVLAQRSSTSSTGYLNVIKLRTDDNGPIYQAKFTPEGEHKQRNVPKSYARDPRTSAAALAYFLAGYLGPLPTKKEYKERSSSEVSRLFARVHCQCTHCSFSLAAGGGQGKRGSQDGPRGAQG